MNRTFANTDADEIHVKEIKEVELTTHHNTSIDALSDNYKYNLVRCKPQNPYFQAKNSSKKLRSKSSANEENRNVPREGIKCIVRDEQSDSIYFKDDARQLVMQNDPHFSFSHGRGYYGSAERLQVNQTFNDKIQKLHRNKLRGIDHEDLIQNRSNQYDLVGENKHMVLSNKFNNRHSSAYHPGYKNSIQGRSLEARTPVLETASNSHIRSHKSRGKNYEKIRKKLNKAKLSNAFNESADLKKDKSGPLFEDSSATCKTQKKKVNIEALIKSTLKREKELKKKKVKLQNQDKVKKEERFLKSKEFNDRIRKHNFKYKDSMGPVKEKATKKLRRRSPLTMNQPATLSSKGMGKRKRGHEDISLGREILKLKKECTAGQDRKIVQKSKEMKKTSKVAKAQRADQQQSWTVDQPSPSKRSKLRKSKTRKTGKLSFRSKIINSKDIIEKPSINQVFDYERRRDIKQYMERKKKKFREEKNKEKVDHQIKAERMKRNLVSLNKKTTVLAKKTANVENDFWKSSKIK